MKKLPSVAAEICKQTAETGLFKYGDDVIRYDIIRRTQGSETRAKRKIVIKVHPDQRVVATVPYDATPESIQEAMLKRARWIWDNIKAFASQHEHVIPKQYVSGETKFYLGKRYVLKIDKHEGAIPSVKLTRGKLTVTMRPNEKSPEKVIKGLLNRWYQTRAKYIFHQRLNEMLPKAEWVKGIPSFRVMAMKKQWGSCSAQGNLMLNPHLVKAPKECIDYVILHELCHIAEYNHSERFWRLLTQVMPNWKEVKARLDDMAELYLNE
ncbi:M48 family metallopeptidase [Alteromonas sp. ASW11-130]|uniref:M48 family metallopeptidase n=1 Tax=Alteromonas sp. ASW11-130 TaxID=3015775 RepID=UPI0022427332|nr:SprT family zinc-dependent metalloprotease [Alteromonas sp. ASW11-130]MCW8093390.1 M48 family metallopeptidase [Alteromonas sp. ASW11-130]